MKFTDARDYRRDIRLRRMVDLKIPYLLNLLTKISDAKIFFANFNSILIDFVDYTGTFSRCKYSLQRIVRFYVDLLYEKFW